MTLHKLWTKMCEKDWRTVVKSLYVLHCISRDCSADACQRFTMAMKSLSRVRNPKNPDHKYFDIRPIADVDANGEPYEKFIAAYATHVIYRTKNFAARFEELKDITGETHEGQVVARLKKAQQCITHGLKCTLADKQLYNVVIGHCLKMVAADLRDLIKLCTAKLGPLLGDGAAYGGTKADEKDVLALLVFFQEAAEQVKVYLSKVQKVCQPMRIKIPTEVEASVSGEKLAARIAELTKISGGSVAVEMDGTGMAKSAEEVSQSMASKGGEDEDEEGEGEGDASEAAEEADEEEEGEGEEGEEDEGED